MESSALARHPAPVTATDPLTTAIRDHARGLWHYLRLLGCPEHHIEDLCQETFLLALQKGLGDRDRRQTGAFLRRTASHLFLRQRHGDRRRARLLAAATEQLWQRHCQDDQGSALLDALRDCIDSLPGRARQAVDLAYHQGLDQRCVGQALGLAASGVKSLLRRIRGGLRECVERRLAR